MHVDTFFYPKWTMDIRSCTGEFTKRKKKAYSVRRPEKKKEAFFFSCRRLPRLAKRVLQCIGQ
jgi:hypothetical protein